MANVKLLLKESIKNVGKVGDIVEVSAGYARNYLLPQDLALQPTPGNIKKVETRRQEIEKQERERRDQQAALLQQLQSVEVTLERRANELGHLFGSVSATDIAKALQTQGFNINPDDVNLPGKLDRINTYMVRIKFAEDLATELKVWVAPDADSKAAIDAAEKAAKDAAKQAEEDAAQKEAVTKDSVHKDAGHKDAVRKEPVRKDALRKDAPRKDAAGPA